MIKRRLKYPYLLIFMGALVILPLLMLGTMVKTNVNDVMVDEPEYVGEEIFDNSLPVVNTTIRVIQPFIDPTVNAVKTFYDYKGEESSQLQSILFYNDTYMQNTGIDYKGENTFEVNAILDGTVVAVRNDEMSGQVVEIEHKGGYTSSYQSLQDIKVQKGDIVSQGQMIALSGENELEKELGNHLHLEIYENGQSVNPEYYLNQEIPYEEENK